MRMDETFAVSSCPLISSGKLAASGLQNICSRKAIVDTLSIHVLVLQKVSVQLGGQNDA
jgi:hypothetical protein